MGRYFVVLDPDSGYHKAVEHGFDLELTGRQFYEQVTAGSDPVVENTSNFYCPPGFLTLMCKPRQFNSDWVRDIRLVNHVLTTNEWSFASGITVNTFEQSATPTGSAISANKWISLPTIPSSITSMNGVNYANLATATAAGFDLSGFKTVAVCGETPLGGIMLEGYSPYLQWQAYGEPSRPIVFGWGRMAAICFRTSIYLMISRSRDLVSWEMLSRIQADPHSPPNPWIELNPANWFPRARSMMYLPMDFTHAALYADGNPDPLKVRIAPAGEVFDYQDSASWWIGMAPDHRLPFQAQIVGFEVADSTPPSVSRMRTLFALGGYFPTQPHTHAIEGVLWKLEGADTTLVVDGNAEATHASASTNQTIVASVRNTMPLTPYGYWESDGTMSQGTFHLRMVPGNPSPNSAYLTPYVRHFDFHIPGKLGDFPSDAIVLDDSVWRRITFNKSLRDPMGNEIKIELWDGAQALLSASGHDERGEYPVEVWEDVNGDGDPDTKRLAGWVTQPDLQLEVTAGTAHASGILPDAMQSYTIHARGLLSRMDQRWLFLPNILNPDTPGYVSHLFAVGTALLQSGFDVTDTAEVEAAIDPLTGSDRANLPGTWRYQSGRMDTEIDGVWAPKSDQTHWEYAKFVATEWAGWVLYEELAGKVRYHPDLQTQLTIFPAAKFFLSGVVYDRKAAATLAGTPLQVWAPGAGKSVTMPRANTVRISGKSANGDSLFHVVRQFLPSVQTPAHEDYLGHEKVESLTSELAVSPGALAIIAGLRLIRSRRKIVDWTVVVPTLAPWDFGPEPLELGRVFTFNGILGDGYLVKHIDGEILSSRVTSATDWSKTQTTITVERLPATASASVFEGDYPGRGGL